MKTGDVKSEKRKERSDSLRVKLPNEKVVNIHTGPEETAVTLRAKIIGKLALEILEKRESCLTLRGPSLLRRKRSPH